MNLEIKRPKKITTKDLLEMVRLYKTGLSCNQIGRVFNIDRTTVRHHLKTRGVEMKTQWRQLDENNFHRGGVFSVASATHQVHRALKEGRLVRPDKCETCGEAKMYKDGRPGIHAHHPDYNKPLDVMWLCRKCHFQWHKFNSAVPLRRSL